MKVVIWGASNIGRTVLFSMANEWNVVGFLDKNKSGHNFCGFKVYNVNDLKKIDFDAVIIANTHGKEIKSFLQNNFPSKDVIDFLYEGNFDPRIGMLNLLAQEISESNIYGCVAEAGVYKGDFSRYINRCFKYRKFYLFDTFNGFVPEDMITEEKLNLSKNNENLFSDGAVDIVRSKLIYKDNVIFKIGNFPDTTIEIKNESFCFASIDFDLYRPTFDAIQFFYNRLTVGGYIMIHDYNNDDFKGVKKAVHELKDDLKFGFIPLGDGGGSIIISK